MINQELSLEEKRLLIKAIGLGLISKAEVSNPNFNPRLYTLRELPLFVIKSDTEGFLDFMGVHLKEQEFHQLIEFYRASGVNQQVIII